MNKKHSSRSLIVQFAWAFMLMSIIPLIMAVALVFIVDAPTIDARIQQARIAIFWMFISSIAGYFVIRKAVITLSGFTKHVKDVVGGDTSGTTLLNEDNEIGELARYFDSITKKLEVKIKELESSKRIIQNIFHKIGEAATSVRGIDSLLEFILQSISSAAGSKGGFIMLADEDSASLKVSVIYSEDAKPPRLAPVKIGNGILGRVAKHGKPVKIFGSELSTEGLNFRSLLCVPLGYKDKMIGIIALFDKKSADSFLDDDFNLFKDVASQTAVAISNYQLNMDVEKAYLDTVRALAMAVEAKDPYSGGHLDRVAKYCMDIGRKIGLKEQGLKILHDGAYLHDLGKIGIRDDVLKKTSRLTDEEYEEMKKHAVIGETIMKPVKSLSKLCSVVRSHQERWDGSGYPDGLKAEDIPLHARILAVADVYDALITERPYKKAMTKEAAAEELKKLAGVKFDKRIVEAFLETL